MVISDHDNLYTMRLSNIDKITTQDRMLVDKYGDILDIGLDELSFRKSIIPEGSKILKLYETLDEAKQPRAYAIFESKGVNKCDFRKIEFKPIPGE